MDQSQILQPCPHFIITLPFMVNFRSKVYFFTMQTSRMEKSILKSVPLGLDWIFFRKKFFFCKIFLIFEFFSNSEAWLQNLRLVHDFSEFSGLFDTYIAPESAFVQKWEIQRLKLLVCNSQGILISEKSRILNF